MSIALQDLPGLDVLDELDMLRNIEHLTACDRLKAVAEFLGNHDASTVDPATSDLPGRQRVVLLGGEGTPRIAEFAPALAGGRLEISTGSAERLCADVLDLVHRLPALWARVCDYTAKVPLARLVASKTRHLTQEQALAVDRRVAESCDGRLPYGRFLTLIEASVAQVDAKAVAAREEAALTETVVRASRSTEHGMRGFYIKAPFPVIARLEATVAHLADALIALGHGGTVEDRRLLAVLVLANPTHAVQLLAAYRRANPDDGHLEAHAPGDVGHAPEGFVLDLEKLLPAVVLYVHLTDQSLHHASGVARVEGLETEHEPITAQWVRQWLGPRCRFIVKPVLIPDALTPVDAYEIPTRHREAVHLMTPVDIFPWGTNTTRRVQIDHTAPFDPHGPPGQSRMGNYGPMTTPHHRMKTHGGWRCAQPFPGIYVWRDPSGATYLVDHTGTRRVTPPLATSAQVQN